MRILAIGAHPDDCEAHVGGTLAKYARAGHDVFYVSVTNGEIGSLNLSLEETAKTRKKEAETAAAVIGAEFICMGFRDQRFIINEEVREAFVDLFRYVNPDVCFTHYQDDFSADHRLVGEIVNDIAMLPMVPHIKTKYPCTDKAPVLYYWIQPHNLTAIPEQFVDISDVIDIKRKMLEAHQTQIDWVKYHTHGDLVGDHITASRFYGMQAGVQYAEPFIMVKAAPRTCCGTLLP